MRNVPSRRLHRLFPRNNRALSPAYFSFRGISKNKPLTDSTPVPSASFKLSRCSAPYPPSPDKTDQHAVVTLPITLCPCDFAGPDLSFGNRTHDAAPRVDQRRL